MLLEEALAVDAVRRAHQAERPVDDERLHARPDRFVVVEQILLADAGLRPQQLVGIAQRHGRAPGLPSAWLVGRAATGSTFSGCAAIFGRFDGFRNDFLGRLVLAQALEGRLAQDAVAGPAAEFDLGDQLRLAPRRTFLSLAAGPSTGGFFVLMRIELFLQIVGDCCRKAGADPAAHSAACPSRDRRRRSERRPRPAAVDGHIADDDEFLPQRAFRLDPGEAAPAAIGRVGALRDHAFEAHAAGMRQHGLARLGEMLAVAQRRVASASRRASARSRCLALDQRLVAQILAVEMQQVEDVEEHAFGAALRQRRLQRREGRHAIVRQHDDLAVDHRLVAVERGQRFGDRARRTCPVQSSPERVNSFTLPSVDMRLHAVAVEFHLVQPFLARRRVRLAASPARAE